MTASMVLVWRLAMNQIRTYKSDIEQKKKRANRKDEKGAGVNSDMKWGKSKRVSKVKRELQEYRERMESALLVSVARGDTSYKEDSMSSKWRVLNEHAIRMGGNSFMGRNVFIEWVKNERSIALHSGWKAVIESFCSKYGCDGGERDNSE